MDALDPPEAKRLLGALVNARPDLLAEVAALASQELGAVGMEQVAEQVAQRVGRLRIEDVWDRSGSRSDGGDMDETEAAWAVVEDAVEPFVRDLERRIRLGRDPEALAICQGVRTSPRRRHDRVAMGAFASKALPDWVSFLTRILGKEPRKGRRR